MYDQRVCQCQYFIFILVCGCWTDHSFDCANHPWSGARAIWPSSLDPLIKLPRKYGHIQSRYAFIEFRMAYVRRHYHDW